MQFLGIVGFVDPQLWLLSLFKVKSKLFWSSSCQRTFEMVKALLSNAPVLAAPQWDRAFCLQVDSGFFGTAGAVLLQADQMGVNRPVCFLSRKLNRHQLNYSIIEIQALLWAFQHFDVYVGCGPVVVYSDHNSNLP